MAATKRPQSVPAPPPAPPPVCPVRPPKPPKRPSKASPSSDAARLMLPRYPAWPAPSHPQHTTNVPSPPPSGPSSQLQPTPAKPCHAGGSLSGLRIRSAACFLPLTSQLANSPWSETLLLASLVLSPRTTAATTSSWPWPKRPVKESAMVSLPAPQPRLVLSAPNRCIRCFCLDARRHSHTARSLICPQLR